MYKALLIFNALSVIIAGAVLGYMVFGVDITVVSYQIYVVFGFIVALMVFLWGLLAYLAYGIRYSLHRSHSPMLLIRSERQSFFIALLVGLHLTLQAFLLWNIFSASILTLAIIVFEYYFLSQEST